MKLLIVFSGWFLALLPRAVAAAISVVLGRLVYFFMYSRRAMMLRNLALCFPEKTEEERRAIGRESCCRMVEMGMFVLASPHFSRERILANFSVDEKSVSAALGTTDGPLVVAVPHFSLMESLTMIPLLYPKLGTRPIGVFYRPFGNAAIEHWVKTTRERWGCKLLSRKRGLTQALDFLHKNGIVCVLPDQGTGRARGGLTLFFGRVASCSELTGALAFGHPGTRTLVAWCERKGFWRGVIHGEELAPAGTPRNEVNFIVQRWIERHVSSSNSACADWLWMHNRWKGARDFNLNHRNNRVEEAARWLGFSEIPRKKKIFIRMPNWLGDVVMALPIVRALREGRPDAELTLVARGNFIPMLAQLNCAEHLITLPKKKSSGPRYWLAVRALFRGLYPEVYVLFTNSLRGDIEAWLSGAPVRCGMERGGLTRPLITDSWCVPADLDLRENHQTLVWARWLRERHKLLVEPDFTPIKLDASAGTPPADTADKPPRIGFICGSENSPEKRWAVERWAELISKLLTAFPSLEIRLFGTVRDAAVTVQIARACGSNPRIVDRAGKTNLPDYMRELSACTVVCGNDTGGLHLANMLGIPVVGIFGPTNPVRTRPIFNAPVYILQPENCPPTGGLPIEKVSADTVFAALEKLVKA